MRPALKGTKTVSRIKLPSPRGFGINNQGIASHRLLGMKTTLYSQAQQQGAKPPTAPALIAGEAAHPKTWHGVGRERLGISRLQIGQRDFRRRQRVKTSNLTRTFHRNQNEGLAHSTPHVLMSVLFQESIEIRFTTTERFAIVPDGVELLLFKHGSPACGPAPRRRSGQHSAQTARRWRHETP